MKTIKFDVQGNLTITEKVTVQVEVKPGEFEQQEQSSQRDISANALIGHLAMLVTELNAADFTKVQNVIKGLAA